MTTLAALAFVLVLPAAFASHCNPGAPTNLAQQNSDMTPLAAGDTTSGAMVDEVILTGDWITVSGSVCGQDGQTDFEVQDVGTPFTNNPTDSSALMNPMAGGATPLSATVVALMPGTTYHWQARNISPSWTGTPGPWSQFAGGGDAFTIASAGAPGSSAVSLIALVLAAMGAMLVMGRRTA